MATDDPLAGLTMRQLEDAKAKIEAALRSCAIDGREGAEPYRITKNAHGSGIRGTILLCRPCFERIRLPESRSSDPAGA